MADLSLAKTSAPTAHGPSLLSMLWRDKLAFISAVVLLIIVLFALLGPTLLGELAGDQNLRGRNAPAFDLARGFMMILGGDQLGRPLLARLIVAAGNTMAVAAGAVILSMVFGSTLGLIAGYLGYRPPPEQEPQAPSSRQRRVATLPPTGALQSLFQGLGGRPGQTVVMR